MAEIELIIKATAKNLILPPGALLFTLFLGIFLHSRRPNFGMSLIVLSALALYALSTPLVSYHLAASIESKTALGSNSLNDEQLGAVVILGGGRRSQAPEYQGEDTVSEAALARLRYGAEIHQQTALPILVTGGTVLSDGKPEGELMAQVLESCYGISDVWIESSSADTYQNALFTKEFLEKESINKVVLVTHAIHMPRALSAFKHVGIEVLPAPMGHRTGHEIGYIFRDFLPNAGSLAATSASLHELIGQVWYRLRHY